MSVLNIEEITYLNTATFSLNIVYLLYYLLYIFKNRERVQGGKYVLLIFLILILNVFALLGPIREIQRQEKQKSKLKINIPYKDFIYIGLAASVVGIILSFYNGWNVMLLLLVLNFFSVGFTSNFLET